MVCHLREVKINDNAGYMTWYVIYVKNNRPFVDIRLKQKHPSCAFNIVIGNATLLPRPYPILSLHLHYMEHHKSTTPFFSWLRGKPCIITNKEHRTGATFMYHYIRNVVTGNTTLMPHPRLLVYANKGHRTSATFMYHYIHNVVTGDTTLMPHPRHLVYANNGHRTSATFMYQFVYNVAAGSTTMVPDPYHLVYDALPQSPQQEQQQQQQQGQGWTPSDHTLGREATPYYYKVCLCGGGGG